MFVKDHPHPLRYGGEYRARVEIAGGELLDGELPPRAARMVREWAQLRRVELEENWLRVEQMRMPQTIEPLP